MQSSKEINTPGPAPREMAFDTFAPGHQLFESSAGATGQPRESLTSLLKYPLTLEQWPITIYAYQASLKCTCTCTFRGKNS